MTSPAFDSCMVSLAVEPCARDPAEHEWAAENLYSTGGLPVPFPAPRLLARRNGFRFRPDPLLCTLTGGLYCNGVIVYRPRADQRRVGGAIFHELAEATLAREFALSGRPYTHGDVWRRTIAFVAPWSSLRDLTQRTRRSPDLALLLSVQAHADAWMLDLRLRQIAELKLVA